jgi:hypothetical protein
MIEDHEPPKAGDDRPWDEILEWVEDTEKEFAPRKEDSPEHYGLSPGSPIRASIAEYLRPAALRCLVLDFTYLVPVVRDNVVIEDSSGVQVLDPALPVDGVVKVIKNLCISANDLKDSLAGLNIDVTRDLRDALVLIRTGWPDAFRPTGSVDVFGSRFEGWLAWFLHPYLDGDAARWIVTQLGVWGVAVDCVNFENPLYYAVAPAWAGAEGARKQMIGTERFPRGLQLAHLNVLWRGKRLIENVGRVSCVPEGECGWGHACVMPFPFTLIGDGAFIRLFLRMEGP